MPKYDGKTLLISAMVITSAIVFNASQANASISSAVSSYVPAVYFGGQVGYSNTHWDKIVYASNQSAKDTGFASRVDVGYDYSQFFAIELGYTHFPRSKYTLVTSGVSNTTTLEEYAVDALLKFTLPIAQTGLGIYAKGGAAYLNSTLSQNIYLSNGVLLNTSANKFGPVYGLGASYNFTTNFVADASWLRYTGHSTQDANYIPNPEAFLIGIRYRIPTSVW